MRMRTGLPIWGRVVTGVLMVVTAVSLFVLIAVKPIPIDCDTTSVDVIITDRYARKCLGYVPRELTRNDAARRLFDESEQPLRVSRRVIKVPLSADKETARTYSPS